MTTKHAHKSFLSQLGGFFPNFSLRVKGRLWVGWVVSFGGLDCIFLLMAGGAGNELGSTLLTLILTPLKTNTQLVCGFGCTLLNHTQILLNHLLAQRRMIMSVLKIFNLNGSNLQVRSKQRAGGASTKQCGTSLDLSEFQPGTIK
jgi:hypothetical protein